ncbi:hypothetical protein QMK61_05580 [Fulvimonas sp. R45]|jgi:hypothetical protein|uniref:hypothetical protein n=1 Tax=Fulvimonas sp. R45 TaxID=3045937 RepID=UPI00265D6946|nr:hypothetical protein [Fulvimonas sp. R45]MDO1528302.1 hypothetical protein [Fulvimonas sp. R45]
MNPDKHPADQGRHAAREDEGRGDMTVREAGQKGGHKGGQRERQLVEEGHEAERRGEGRHHE